MRPEIIGAKGEYAAAENDRPVTIAAELATPGYQPKRRCMQRMFQCISDGAVDLMRDCNRL